ncbi:MAG: hypothetical protein FWC41_09680, partial [Firmicutes bacterium]|nr:hypothetical protein [Bacillota bacterium]
IAGFISTCNNFSPSYYGVSDYFPNVNDKVQKSRTYINSNLDNSKVNNCERLKAGLREIPKKLFDKHITYLHKKINENGSRYKEFNYQSDYSNTIYTPLKNQIDALDNDVYGVSDNVFENERNTLENLLSNRNRDAVDYFRQLNQQKW